MKKKIILGLGVSVIAIVVAMIFILVREDKTIADKKTLKYVKENFESDVQTLKEGKYDNLKYNAFTTSIDNIESLHNIEIMFDKTYKQKTLSENLENVDRAIDNFFKEDFDKSFMTVYVYTSSEDFESVDYNNIKEECASGKYDGMDVGIIFGNNTLEGGYMIQTSIQFQHSWFSRYGLKDIGPFDNNPKKTISYISCRRQVEDVELNLLDGMVKLSEMEDKVLKFTNEEFPLPISEGISFGIGEAKVIDNGDTEGISFKMRRIYKGVPFEYGSSGASGNYIDPMNHDAGNVAYASSEFPDTMCAFGLTNGTVVEKESITELISLGEALDLLSQQIGSNSVYDVYGVELVYRSKSDEIPENSGKEIREILKPVWKFITINQNDDKYTLFYIDVVTGEITERFEYYNE